jgi:hypothetical protein
MNTARPTTNRLRPGALALITTSLIGLGAACSGGGGGGGGGVGVIGSEMAKPSGGGSFFVDPNQAGTATRLQIVEVVWGRLVDVHDIEEATGEIDTEPVFRDFVINENIQSDGTNYLLDTNAITQKTRLVILRERGGTNTGQGTFNSLLRAAEAGLPPIVPKNDDGTSPGPYSFMARNGALMIRFNDALDDSQVVANELIDLVKVQTGYTPTIPYFTRVQFDQNHGAIASGGFHSTRIIVDMTVSVAESSEMTNPVPVNSQGLPSSLPTASSPNISIRIPTVESAARGQFRVLRGVSGVPLSSSANGPIDMTVPTEEIVRAFRAGNVQDSNNGFLLDLNAPEVVGAWGISVDNVRVDTFGKDGFDFLVDVTFDSLCQSTLEAGDILTVGDLFLEVNRTTNAPNQNKVFDVGVRSLTVDPIVNPTVLFGAGFFRSTFDPGAPVPLACWISFAPRAAVLPATGVSTTAQAVINFSEPMEPTKVTPFQTFMMIRGDSGLGEIEAENVVVGTTAGTADLKTFAFTSILPLAHIVGVQEPHYIHLEDVTDLAGNSLKNRLPDVDFTLLASDPTERNASVALRFSDLDEVKPVNLKQGVLDDIRGQIFYDFDRGTIKPRPVTYTSYPVDRNNPVPAIMIPFPPGVQTPLSPLGSKLQAIWRHADLGWNVKDETKYNLDVYGLHWSPAGGLVLRDFFERFEIRLAHSRRIPDEAIDTNLLPKWANTGLVGAPSEFDANILADPLSPQAIVHPRNRGYNIDPSDLGATVAGTPLMPFPLNQGARQLTTWTWRDTSVLARGGPSGLGVPLDIEAGPPLDIVPASDSGSLYPANRVRSAGLPLLMEFRCFPSDSGIGLNPLDISLAINSSVVPNFRAFSTGGVNNQGKTIRKNPDLERVPDGGFNPSNNGAPTRFTADNSLYIGQLDAVTRVSRAHTVWIDTLFNSPDYLAPVVIPAPQDQPQGTQVIIDYRGAKSFAGNVGNKAFDASDINTYGDVVNSNKPPVELGVTYQGGVTWKNDIADIKGARYFQMRFTFINNIDTGVNAELSAVGVAFTQ